MTARRPVVLHCDWPGCYVRHEACEATIIRARKAAATAGWISVDGLDFCGPGDRDRGPIPRSEPLIATAFTPSDHAYGISAGDHAPAHRRGTDMVPADATSDTERASFLLWAQGYQAGCTCGWRARRASPHSTATEQWRRHLGEVLRPRPGLPAHGRSG